MTPVHFIYVNVPDDVVISFNQRAMGLGFVLRVVRIEHGPHAGAADFPHHFRRFRQRMHHVALRKRQGFHQDGDAALRGMRRHARQAIHEIAARFRRRQSAGGGTLFRRSENHDPVRLPVTRQIGAEIDQIPDVLPAALPQIAVRRGDVNRFLRHQQPVQTDEAKSLARHHRPVLRALRRRDIERIRRQRERRDLNAFIPGAAQQPAHLIERLAFKGLITHRVVKGCAHQHPSLPDPPPAVTGD